MSDSSDFYGSDYHPGERFNLMDEPDMRDPIPRTPTHSSLNFFETYTTMPPPQSSRSDVYSVQDFLIISEQRKIHLPSLEVVDLRALEYVKVPNENLVCPICTSPFVKPVELACEHMFCEDCLSDHLKSQIQSATLCPKCRSPIESIRPVPKLLGQLLDELHTICPNKECGASHERYTMNDHVSRYCDFTEVSCPSMECVIPIQRRFLEDSLRIGELCDKEYLHGCLHSKVTCEECEECMMEVEMEEHLEAKCSSGLLDCEYCALNMRRGQLRNHHNENCEMFPTACRGQVIGCPLKGARHAVNEHMKTCPIAIMTPHFLEQNARQAQLQDETTRLRIHLLDLDRTLDVLKDEFKDLSHRMNRDRRRSQATENTVSASRLEEMTSRVDEMSTDFTSRLDNATSDNARMHMAFMSTDLRNQQQFHTINATLTALRTHLNHLTVSRAAGNNASSATNSVNAGSSGVSMDVARREPPKL